MTAKQLIEQAVSLPVEERALVVDSLLRSLNQPDTEIDRRWVALAERRLLELRNGSVQGVPGERVFKRSGKGSISELYFPPGISSGTRCGDRVL